VGHFTSLSMAVESSVPVSRINVKKVVDQFKDSPKYARKILEQLIKAGAYVSGKDESGKTPLHIAAQEDNILAARILVKHGAKLKEKDNAGKMPYDYAKSEEMIKLLSRASINWYSIIFLGLCVIVILLTGIIILILKKR